MEQSIKLPITSERTVLEKRLRERVAELESLIWQDIDAIHQLDDYCLNRRNIVDDRVKDLLVKKGILAEDGTLPDLTNEAMYELRTGEEPFWLQ